MENSTINYDKLDGNFKSVTNIEEEWHETTDPPFKNDCSATYQVYPERWYILLLFLLLGLSCNMVYATLSPIANFAKAAFGLTKGDISMLANWNNIMFVVGVFPYMWLIQVKGLRMPVTSGAVFVAAGSLIRCLNTGGLDHNFDLAMLHIGHIVNGMASSILWFACTKISAVWFPPKERYISTSIGLMTGCLGVGISFLIGPYTVTELASRYANSGEPTNEDYAQAIRSLFYIQAVFCCTLCSISLFYFPSQPSTPPSYTASADRMGFLEGVVQFAKSRDAWLIFILYSISGAVLGGWTLFLAITVKDVIGDIEAGWLGFALQIAQFVAGPLAALIGRGAIHRHPKMVCTSLLFIGASLVSIFWIAEAFVPSILTSGLLWGTLVPAALFITAGQPVWWEMACDAAYPVPEQIVAGIFALGLDVLSILFFAAYSINALGTQWANWCFSISELLCVPLLLLYRGQKRRSADDQYQ